MPEIRGTLALEADGHGRLTVADGNSADETDLSEVLKSMLFQPVRVLHQSGHGGREWVVIERVVPSEL